MNFLMFIIQGEYMNKYDIHSCYTNTYSLVKYHEIGVENLAQYLQINSCGYCDTIPALKPVTRYSGRNDYFVSYNYCGEIYVEQNEETLTASAGDVLFYVPGEPQIYHYDCSKYLSNYWIHFTGHGANELFSMLNIPSGVPYHIGYIPEIENLIKQIIFEINSNRPGSIFYAASLFMQIIALINKKNSGNLLQGSSLHNDSVFKTTEYIQENLSEKISIQSLASMSFLSVNRYTNVFKLLMGVTPREYIINLRLQKAIELMKVTNLSISEISVAVGYDDQMYFSRLFKKYLKITPSEFRKSNN